MKTSEFGLQVLMIMVFGQQRGQVKLREITKYQLQSLEPPNKEVEEVEEEHKQGLEKYKIKQEQQQL